MGLAFLPWEKLPLWISGPLLAILNVWLFAESAAGSSHQIEAAIFVCIGIGMFVFGVMKPTPADSAPSLAQELADYQPVSLAETPDFSAYSHTQLRQILLHIDGERFPERVRAIHARLAGQPIP